QDAGRIAEDIERDLILDAAGARAYGLVDHVLENRNAVRAPHGAR
ncbi:ATP-dependent Clp protease proteolytic subunit, partial [Streptomyces sp. NPDC001274]